MKSAAVFFAAAIAVSVGGCGGGGAGISTAAAPAVATTPGTVTPAAAAAPVTLTPVTAAPGAAVPPVTPSQASIVIQLNAAISALFGLPHEFNNSVKTAAGDTYDARVVYSNIIDTNIENRTVKSVDIKRTVAKNGAPFFNSAETSFFQLSPYRLVATKTPDSSLYVVASNQVALPITAKSGDGGPYYESTTYDSIGKNLVLSTAVHTWSVVAESAATVLFCDNSTISVAQVSGKTTRADCYQIDSDSNVVSNRLAIPGIN